MKEFFGAVFSAVIMGCLAVAFIVGLSFGSYKMYEYFAPRYTAVDAKVFKESVQYNEGMQRDLSELQRQYITADADGKAALKPIIRHRFEVYDRDRLPADLRSFYDSINSSTSN
jgi:hypothetical protein